MTSVPVGQMIGSAMIQRQGVTYWQQHRAIKVRGVGTPMWLAIDAIQALVVRKGHGSGPEHHVYVIREGEGYGGTIIDSADTAEAAEQLVDEYALRLWGAPHLPDGGAVPPRTDLPRPSTDAMEGS